MKIIKCINNRPSFLKIILLFISLQLIYSINSCNQISANLKGDSLRFSADVSFNYSINFKYGIDEIIGLIVINSKKNQNKLKGQFGDVELYYKGSKMVDNYICEEIIFDASRISSNIIVKCTKYVIKNNYNNTDEENIEISNEYNSFSDNLNRISIVYILVPLEDLDHIFLNKTISGFSKFQNINKDFLNLGYRKEYEENFVKNFSSSKLITTDRKITDGLNFYTIVNFDNCKEEVLISFDKNSLDTLSILNETLSIPLNKPGDNNDIFSFLQETNGSMFYSDYFKFWQLNNRGRYLKVFSKLVFIVMVIFLYN